jgi:hypothetical protein
VAADTLAKLDLTGEWVFTNSGAPNDPVRAQNFHTNFWARFDQGQGKGPDEAAQTP